MSEPGLVSKSLVRRIFLGIIIVLIFLDFPWLCQSHGHSHEDEDEHEPPSFKYSEQANVQYGNKHKPEEKKKNAVVKEDTFSLWTRAIGSTVLISAAPFLVLYLVPLDNSKEREPLLKILLSFASGSLLGDAFLHLIPHALNPHSSDAEHSHSHSHNPSAGHSHGPHDMRVGFWVLLGIVVFLVVEKFVRLMKGGHGHSHSAAVPAGTSLQKDDDAKVAGKENDASETKKEKKEQTPPAAHDQGEIKVAGYLNLAADFTHNFTDGLAIGASYLAGKNVGLVTTLTILLHEVPHEIGDFAILIQSGCSRKKAMYLQLMTALGALSGTVISLLAEGMGDLATSGILPFTAGGFIYIATVSVIPELLSDTKFWQSVKEMIALLVGVYMMVLIAAYE